MHVCPDCGKAMATAGGLEIHIEMQHAPPPAPNPVPDPAPTPAQPGRSAPTTYEPAPVRAAARAPSPILRGYDATVPLTALLVLALLVAGVGAAVHRSTSPTHQIVASLPSGATTPSGQATPTTIAPVPPQASAPPAPSPAGSPAAIPPAGSQSPAAAQNSPTTDDCKQLVDSLSNRNSKRSLDITHLVRTNTFPALPLPGFDHPAVAGVYHYGTATDLVAGGDPNDPDRNAIQQLLIQNGFVGADIIEYTNGGSSYGAGVFQFTTAAGARAYNRGSTLLACNDGLIEDAKVMPALSGGMNYVLDEGPPFRATLVAGDTVVRLQICHCVQAPDDQVLAGQWAQAVASAVGAG